MRPDGDLMTTDRQSTSFKAAIEPDQITLSRLAIRCDPKMIRLRFDVDASDIRRSAPGLIAL